MLRTSTIFFLVLVFCGQLNAQGIKGNIQDIEGNPLPFASIYVKQAGTGTSSNLEGDYELPLRPGAYDVSFQFMGFASEQHRIQVGSGFTVLNIKLKPQVYDLPTVVVSGKAEDPSYTIMRKAIAKAKYHLLQNDSYTAQVYMKGTGQLTKVPWFLRKTLEKEGVDTSRVFTSESVSEISFERPNTFSEKVISVRASGEDMANASPNSYINSSFYLPKVVNAISPLHPRAFSYYKFEYQGSFRENGYEVNKIKVTPRSKGDDVFEGEIYIREDFWNIYSLNLNTSIYGFEVQVQQIYAPIEDEVWMPVTQQYEFSGQIFGVAGKYSYLASVSNYEVVPNTDLDASVLLVDEKIEPAPEEIDAIKEKNLEVGMEQVFDEEKEVSRKQFRKMMKEYEKQELEETEEPDVISDYSYKMDSLAAKKDSLYWESIRPVPLTSKEVAGYAKDDSTYVAEKIQAEADSNKVRNGQKFKLGQLVVGSYYKLGERLRFNYPGLLQHTQFNAVEGLNLTLTGTFQWRNDTTTRLRISPFVRYGFSSEQPYAKVESVFGIGKAEKRSTIRVSGGNYVEQFNPEIINPFMASLHMLFLEKNYMALYEKQFAKASYARRFNYRYTIGASLEYANRSNLFNNSDFTFLDREDRAYRSNAPFNVETVTSGFSNNTALISNLSFRAMPWVKFRKYNGRLIPLYDRSPEFRLTYRKGIDAGTDTQFDHLELGVKADIRLGVRATIDIDAEAGKFFGNQNLEFMDFKHFRGNELIVSPLDVNGRYRMLDFYRYSTSQEYVSALTHVRFRKLALTHIPAVRLMGIKENFFVNYLYTPGSNNYTEVGYTIDNLFRVVRLEFVQTFENWKARDFGVRIGFTTIFNN